MNRAFEKRQLGDYEFTSTISDEDASELMLRGKEFREAVARWVETESA